MSASPTIDAQVSALDADLAARRNASMERMLAAVTLAARHAGQRAFAFSLLRGARCYDRSRHLPRVLLGLSHDAEARDRVLRTPRSTIIQSLTAMIAHERDARTSAPHWHDRNRLMAALQALLAERRAELRDRQTAGLLASDLRYEAA